MSYTLSPRPHMALGSSPTDGRSAAFSASDQAYPFSVDAYGDISGTGENTDRPDVISNPYAGVSHSVQDHQPVQWINPNAFTVNYGEFGTMGRNQLFGPGFGDVDFSVLKDTSISERFDPVPRRDIQPVQSHKSWNPTFTGANGLIAIQDMETSEFPSPSPVGHSLACRG